MSTKASSPRSHDTSNDGPPDELLDRQAQGESGPGRRPSKVRTLHPSAAAHPEPEIVETLKPLVLNNASDLPQKTIRKRREIISGILRPGEFMIYAADAKSGKTWLGLMLAHAISLGREVPRNCEITWLGKPILHRCPVVYFNFELDDITFEERLREIVAASDHKIYPKHLHYVSMRGNVTSSLGSLIDRLELTTSEMRTWYRPGVIIFDSLYNTYGELDENSNSQMALHMKEILSITERLKCAVVFLHHFNKSSGYASNDSARASGAHALHRAPDALVTGTIIKGKEAHKLGINQTDNNIYLRITPSVRSFKESEPFMIKREKKGWKYAPLTDADFREMKESRESMKAEKTKKDNGAIQGAATKRTSVKTSAKVIQVAIECFGNDDTLQLNTLIAKVHAQMGKNPPEKGTIEMYLRKAANAGIGLEKDGFGKYRKAHRKHEVMPPNSPSESAPKEALECNFQDQPMPRTLTVDAPSESPVKILADEITGNTDAPMSEQNLSEKPTRSPKPKRRKSAPEPEEQGESTGAPAPGTSEVDLVV